LVFLCFLAPQGEQLFSTTPFHHNTLSKKQQSQSTMDWNFWNHEPKDTILHLVFLRYLSQWWENWIIHHLTSNSFTRHTTTKTENRFSSTTYTPVFIVALFTQARR
jgi:hypothetical protein